MMPYDRLLTGGGLGLFLGSYSVGLLGALAYIRMLSNSVEAIGSASVASAAL